MKNLKTVKTGDVIKLSAEDKIFIETCFQPALNAEKAAQRFMETAFYAFGVAWKNVREKWPELEGYNCALRAKTGHLVVQERRRKGQL